MLNSQLTSIIYMATDTTAEMVNIITAGCSTVIVVPDWYTQIICTFVNKTKVKYGIWVKRCYFCVCLFCPSAKPLLR